MLTQRATLKPRSPRNAFLCSVLVITTTAVVITPQQALAQGPRLTSAVVRGSTVYDAAELFSSYRDQLGQPITRASARTISAQIAGRYERDGYARPQVRIDDGLLAAGVLRIDVLETRIVSLDVSGNPGPYRERLHELSAPLLTADIVRPDALQDTLRRIRALPGLSVSAATSPDEIVGNGYRLDLDADYEPVTAAFRVTNRGTDEVGPNFVLGQTVVNGLLGGSTTAGVLFGAAQDYEEYRGLGAVMSIATGDAGGRVSTTGFRARSNPREPGTDRDDRFVRDRLSVRVDRPLHQSPAADIGLSFALEAEDLAIFRSGERLRDERLRMLETGVRATWRKGGATQSVASAELVKGLGGLGSGLTALDLSDDPRRRDFLLMRMSFIRLTQLSARWSVRLDAFAQQSNDVLPYSERFKIGGDRLGRGFEVAEIAGDQGVGAKVQIDRHLRRVPTALGRASVYGFYDIAATWKETVPDRESAASAGFGLSVRRGQTRATLELAQPLTHADVEGRKDLSLFVEITLQL